MKKAVTIKDIAKKIGMSYSTISRALNQNLSISLATRQLVKETADELGGVATGVAILCTPCTKKMTTFQISSTSEDFVSIYTSRGML